MSQTGLEQILEIFVPSKQHRTLPDKLLKIVTNISGVTFAIVSLIACCSSSKFFMRLRNNTF
jgi:hypothetical protein